MISEDKSVMYGQIQVGLWLTFSSAVAVNVTTDIVIFGARAR